MQVLYWFFSTLYKSFNLKAVVLPLGTRKICLQYTIRQVIASPNIGQPPVPFNLGEPSDRVPAAHQQISK
jgi:hypothetical protein